MSDSVILTSNDDRRVCERTHYKLPVILYFENARYMASTVDVSLGGIMLELEQESHDIRPGQGCELQIKNDNGAASANYPCQIVRCNGKSLALNMDKKHAARFGIAMTKGLFKQGA